jgi:hypothetical protein
MLRGQSWAFICSFVILAIAITGICLAVTPVAASFPQVNSNPYSATLATTMHDQGPDPETSPALASSQPSTDGCLLCYSPSHNMLARLSGWMDR